MSGALSVPSSSPGFFEKPAQRQNNHLLSLQGKEGGAAILE